MSGTFILSVLTLLIAILNPSLTICLCGHLDWMSLPGNLLAIVGGCMLLVFGKDRRQITLALTVAALVIGTVVLTKNVADILWFGHDPLFS